MCVLLYHTTGCGAPDIPKGMQSVLHLALSSASGGTPDLVPSAQIDNSTIELSPDPRLFFLMTLKENIYISENQIVAEWWSRCFAYVKTWVQLPALHWLPKHFQIMAPKQKKNFFKKYVMNHFV